MPLIISNQIPQCCHVLSAEVCGVALLVIGNNMVEIRPDKGGAILAQSKSEKAARYNLILTDWRDYGEGICPTSEDGEL